MSRNRIETKSKNFGVPPLGEALPKDRLLRRFSELWDKPGQTGVSIAFSTVDASNIGQVLTDVPLSSDEVKDTNKHFDSLFERVFKKLPEIKEPERKKYVGDAEWQEAQKAYETANTERERAQRALWSQIEIVLYISAEDSVRNASLATLVSKAIDRSFDIKNMIRHKAMHVGREDALNSIDFESEIQQKAARNAAIASSGDYSTGTNPIGFAGAPQTMRYFMANVGTKMTKALEGIKGEKPDEYYNRIANFLKHETKVAEDIIARSDGATKRVVSITLAPPSFVSAVQSIADGTIGKYYVTKFLGGFTENMRLSTKPRKARVAERLPKAKKEKTVVAKPVLEPVAVSSVHMPPADVFGDLIKPEGPRPVFEPLFPPKPEPAVVAEQIPPPVAPPIQEPQPTPEPVPVVEPVPEPVIETPPQEPLPPPTQRPARRPVMLGNPKHRARKPASLKDIGGLLAAGFGLVAAILGGKALTDNRPDMQNPDKPPTPIEDGTYNGTVEPIQPSFVVDEKSNEEKITEMVQNLNVSFGTHIAEGNKDNLIRLLKSGIRNIQTQGPSLVGGTPLEKEAFRRAMDGIIPGITTVDIENDKELSLLAESIVTNVLHLPLDYMVFPGDQALIGWRDGKPSVTYIHDKPYGDTPKREELINQ